jgi:hypothetical protein
MMFEGFCRTHEAATPHTIANGHYARLKTVPCKANRAAAVNRVMTRLRPGVAPGLQPALEDMVARLVGVATTEARLEFINSMELHEVPGEIVVSPTPPDPVTAGIVRRFTSRSRYTCHVCARSGLSRDDLGGAVRCPSCAAPALLRAGIRQMLAQLRCIAVLPTDPAGLVSDELVPPLLRRAARKTLQRSRQSSIDGEGLSVSSLTSWCNRLGALASRSH